MNKKAKTDLLSSLLAIGFGTYVFIISNDIVVKRKGGDIGSAFLPKLIAGIMIGLGALLLISTLLQIRKNRGVQEEPKQTTPLAWLPTALSFANLIVYVLIFKPVGFLISTFLYLFLQMLIMSPSGKKSPRKLLLWALTALVTTVVIYLLFTKAFTMPLPKGILG